MFMTKGKVMSGNREELCSQVQYKTEKLKTARKIFERKS